MSLWRTNGDLPYHQAVNNAERASAVPTTTMLLKYINEHKSDAINILDNKRQTALHIAVRHASYKVVNVLLQGVDHIKVDGKDSSGMAPMDSAVQAAAYTMVLLLQSYWGNWVVWTIKAYMPLFGMWLSNIGRFNYVIQCIQWYWRTKIYKPSWWSTARMSRRTICVQLQSSGILESWSLRKEMKIRP